jgi:hypothetical protein
MQPMRTRGEAIFTRAVVGRSTVSARERAGAHTQEKARAAGGCEGGTAGQRLRLREKRSGARAAAAPGSAPEAPAGAAMQRREREAGEGREAVPRIQGPRPPMDRAPAGGAARGAAAPARLAPRGARRRGRWGRQSYVAKATVLFGARAEGPSRARRESAGARAGRARGGGRRAARARGAPATYCFGRGGVSGGEAPGMHGSPCPRPGGANGGRQRAARGAVGGARARRPARRAGHGCLGTLWAGAAVRGGRAPGAREHPGARRKAGAAHRG